MKTIKLTPKNLKNKPASIITIVILFAMIIFTVSVATGCCAGWDCGPYYYGHPAGWHGDNGEHRGNVEHGDNGWHGDDSGYRSGD